MAKEKRSAADLDAELAALEAELAALEGKPKKAAKAKAASAPAPASASQPEPTPEPAPAREEKKSRFAIPKLGKKKADTEPELASAPAASATPTLSAPPASPAPPPASPPPPLPSYDLSLWRQDGDAWVRRVPETEVPILRRVLDESGNVVREELATTRDLDEARGVKAERGIGRLLRRK